MFEASIIQGKRQILSCLGNDEGSLIAWIHAQFELHAKSIGENVIGKLRDLQNETEKTYVGHNPHYD